MTADSDNESGSSEEEQVEDISTQEKDKTEEIEDTVTFKDLVSFCQ